MNILYIDNSAISYKAGRYLTYSKNGELLLKLKNAGHTVTAFQFVSESESISTFDYQANDIRVLPQCRLSNKILSYILADGSLIRAVRKSDCVYIYYPNAFKPILPVCRLLSIPYGLYIRGMIGVTNRLSKWNYRHASFIIETGKFAEKVGCEAYLPKPMINYTQSDINRNRSYPSAIERLHILFLGRLDKQKGLVELLEAARKLSETGREFHLTIVGNGGDKKELISLQRKFDLESRVTFYGVTSNAEEIKSLYRDADVYIIPTYHEGFPRTIYEAMIFGTPVITTMVGGIPDLMKDGHNCKAIAPRSVDSIVDALEYVYSHYDEAVRWAKQGFADISQVLERPTHAEVLLAEIAKLYVK